MIGEIQFFGLLAPASLVSAAIAGVLIFLLRRALARTGIYRLIWHPGLFDLALYVLLWGGVALLIDPLKPNLPVFSW
jgi:hypothetical protein